MKKRIKGALWDGAHVVERMRAWRTVALSITIPLGVLLSIMEIRGAQILFYHAVLSQISW